MGSGLDWNEICESISTDFYCLAIDLPGHGKSKIKKDESAYSIQNTASYIIDFLQSRKIGSCHLIGYSMGGRLAFFLAIHYPEFFQKIIIESASPGIKSKVERNERAKHDFNLAKKLESGNFKHFLLDWYNQPIFNVLKRSKNFANLLKSRLQNDPVELAKSLREMSTGKQPSLWDKLHLIKNDVLLIAGEFDQKYRNIVTATSSEIKSSKTVIIKRSGHNSHFENRNEFIEQIRKFVTIHLV
jgi:2-succinyl-6-hydroxy-2,4-cyclohexadiene-1-carboxylate synthase